MDIIDEIGLNRIHTKEEAKNIVLKGRNILGTRANNARNPDIDYSINKQIELLNDIDKGLDSFTDENENPLFIIQTYRLVYDMYSTPELRSERITNCNLICDAISGNGESAYILSQIVKQNDKIELATDWENWAIAHGYIIPKVKTVTSEDSESSSIHYYRSAKELAESISRVTITDNYSTDSKALNVSFQNLNLIAIFKIACVLMIVGAVLYYGSKYFNNRKGSTDSNITQSIKTATTDEKGKTDGTKVKTTGKNKKAISYPIVSKTLYNYEIRNKEGADRYKSIQDNFGNKYENGIGGVKNEKDGYLDYDLKGNYKKFSGRIVLDSESKSMDVEDTFVTIYGDEQELYSSSLVTAGFDPEDFEIDVTGISTLRIETGKEPVARIVDPYLYVDASEEHYSTEVSYRILDDPYIEDVIWYYSTTGYGFNTENDITDNYGNHYSHGISSVNHIFTPEGSVVPQYTPTDCTYRVEGQANKLIGRVVLAEEYANTISNVSDGDGHVYIFCDDEEVFRSGDVQKGYEGEDFEIDLQNVKDLRIKINNMSPAIRVVDCRFD